MSLSYIEPGLFDGAARIDRWPWRDLEPRAYGLIMIDPPWHMEMYSEAGEEKSPQAYYRTMSLDEIAALPVADLAASDCLLWLWGTTPLLPKQCAIMEGWGFRYSTNAVWAKRTKHGKRHFGTGYGGFRNEHEHIIVGRIGSPKFDDKAIRSIIYGEAREYSRKPEEAYQAAERLMPRVRRADVFSRQRRAGWDAFGDEVGLFDARSDSADAEPAGSRRYLQTSEGSGERRPAAGTAVAASKEETQ